MKLTKEELRILAGLLEGAIEDAKADACEPESQGIDFSKGIALRENLLNKINAKLED